MRERPAHKGFQKIQRIVANLQHAVPGALAVLQRKASESGRDTSRFGGQRADYLLPVDGSLHITR